MTRDAVDGKERDKGGGPGRQTDKYGIQLDFGNSRGPSSGRPRREDKESGRPSIAALTPEEIVEV